MTPDYLTIAEGALLAAYEALSAETRLTVGDCYAVYDALSLTTDALSQVRGAMAERLPERPIYERGAA